MRRRVDDRDEPGHDSGDESAIDFVRAAVPPTRRADPTGLPGAIDQTAATLSSGKPEGVVI